MSEGDTPKNIAALSAQLAAVQAELEALQQHYNVTVIDIGQILRAHDRVRAYLPDDHLTDESPIFHREFDPPLLQAIKRKIHRLAQEKAANAERLRDQNPNRNADREVIAKLFEEICDEALIAGRKRPGRRALRTLAIKLARQRGLDCSISEPAAYAYLKTRNTRDAEKNK